MYEIKVFTVTQKNGKVYYTSCIVSKIWFLNVYDFVFEDKDGFGISRTENHYCSETYDYAFKTAFEIVQELERQEKELEGMKIADINVNTHLIIR